MVIGSLTATGVPYGSRGACHVLATRVASVCELTPCRRTHQQKDKGIDVCSIHVVVLEQPTDDVRHHHFHFIPSAHDLNVRQEAASPKEVPGVAKYRVS